MSKVKVYYDLMSQPCRSLMILLEMTKYPHEKVEVALRKGMSHYNDNIPHHFNYRLLFY